MDAMAPARPLTAEDLFVVSASSDQRFELDRGALVRMPPAGAVHSAIALRLGRLLAEHVDAAALGVVVGADCGFVLARQPDVVRAPDAAFVARERVPPAGPPSGFWPLAPDLAVEVASPSDRVEDLDEKIAQYFAAGTRLVWVVHPRTRAVHVYRSSAEVHIRRDPDDLDGGDVLPAFRCQVSRLFS